MYGNNVQLAKCSTKHIKVGEETIVGSDKINLLGTDIDKNQLITNDNDNK